MFKAIIEELRKKETVWSQTQSIAEGATAQKLAELLGGKTEDFLPLCKASNHPTETLDETETKFVQLVSIAPYYGYTHELAKVNQKLDTYYKAGERRDITHYPIAVVYVVWQGEHPDARVVRFQSEQALTSNYANEQILKEEASLENFKIVLATCEQYNRDALNKAQKFLEPLDIQSIL